MEIHLFETRLNSHGRHFLLRINKWAMVFYACTILTCIFDLINAYFAFKDYVKFSGNYPAIIKFQSIVSSVFLVIYPVLLVLTGYFFYQFTHKSIKALQNENESDYNNSLGFLLKHIIIASVLFALNSLWALMLTYVQIKTGYE
jgi:hypothetical protein